MEIYNLDSMIRGWFIGNFEPSVYKNKEFEVAVKRYKKGDYEKKHYHKISTEVTVIISGCIQMNGNKFEEGEIIILSPMEASDFECLSDVALTVVVKYPGGTNDKYISNDKK